MLLAVGLGTFALVRALKSALHKDTIAIREISRKRPSRQSYNRVEGTDDTLEEAYEQRREVSSTF